MLAFKKHRGTPSQFINVLRKAALEGVWSVWLVTECHQFPSDLLGFPQQVLVCVVQRWSRKYLPIPAQCL